VVSVSSLFFKGVEVYVGVSVRISTPTQTLHVGYWDASVSPGARTRHLESPRNLGGLNVDIHIRYGYQVHVCIYILGSRMKSGQSVFPFKHML